MSVIVAIIQFILSLFASKPAPAPESPPAPPWPALTEKDRDTLTRTLFGEAANESEAGQIAVVHVVRNRLLRGPAKRFGGTPADVCTKPWQFSCWNANDPQLPRLLALQPASPTYQRLAAVVDKAWAMEDTVGGADHYFANYVATPSWAKPPARMTTKIGVHQFYAGVA